MSDPAARAISTASIWLSVAIIIAFGLCRMNFSEGIILLGVLVFICGFAALATALVWRAAPRNPDLPLGR